MRVAPQSIIEDAHLTQVGEIETASTRYLEAREPPLPRRSRDADLLQVVNEFVDEVVKDLAA